MRTRYIKQCIFFYSFLFSVFPILLFTFISCEEPPVEELDTSIGLAIDSVSFGEVWFKVSVVDPSSDWDFLLSRNGGEFLMANVKGKDTVVVDEGVEPNTSYTYQAYRLKEGSVVDSSKVVTVKTEQLNSTIDLSVDYAGLREVHLRVGVEEPYSGWTFLLSRDGEEVLTGFVRGADTVVVDDVLEPATLYMYQAYRLEEGTPVDSSGVVMVSTMDTTNHDLMWEKYILGDPVGGSATLRDVAILSDNNIWVVGEFYSDEYDSIAGTDYTLYGAAIWDGEKWSLKQLIAGYSNVRPRGIWAFSDNDIWFASGSIYHWNGQETILEWLRDIYSEETVDRIWAASPSNIYFVGNGGVIIHYDGTTFTKMESGTDLPLQDIWGGMDPETGELIVVCVASNIWQNEGHKLLKIEGETVREIPDDGLDWSFRSSGVWFSPKSKYYIVGDGIYEKSCLMCSDQWEGGVITNYFSYGVRGNAMNDIIVVGAFGEVLHYNGSTWKSFMDETALGYGRYKRVEIKGDIVYAVGQDYGRAVVLIGRRE